MFAPEKMYLFFAIVTVISLQIAYSIPTRKEKFIKEFKYKQCGKPNGINVKFLQINPMPIMIPGTIKVKLTANVTQVIPNSIDLKVTIRKLQNKKWQRMPCIANTWGSCKYSDIPTCLVFEEILDCPLVKKYYNITYNLQLGDPGYFAKAILTGNYRATMKVRHPVSRQLLSCVRGQFSVET